MPGRDCVASKVTIWFKTGAVGEKTNTAVGTGFVVTGLQHDIAMVRGLEHTATYRVHTHETGPWLVLDHATLGKLDSGRELAY